MGESSADEKPTGQTPRGRRLHEVSDEELRTGYYGALFQVRMPVELHGRLCEWAKQERKSPEELLIEILEEGVRSRGS